MNSVRQRALILGLAGPAIQVLGFVWEGAHLTFGHGGEPLAARHLFFEPGVLVIAVGLLVSLVCVPVALEVARASTDDLEIPAFGATEQQDATTVEAVD